MEKKDGLKSKTISGLVWQFSQNFVGKFFGFVVTVILARLLLPDDYGVVALAGMFNVLSSIFVTGSMDFALVQKKDVDELDYNTVFYSATIMSFFIYFVIYAIAPLMADLYNMEILTPVMRTLALGLPIGGVSMVLNARVTRAMEFKKFFKSSLLGQIIAAGVGIYMAYRGYGVWALVAQSLIGSVTSLFAMIYMVRWWPRLLFSFERFKILFDYAWKKTSASFIGTFCDQLKGYLIGYQYSASDLAFFNRGEGLPGMVKENIAGTIDKVLFPALSQIQDDKDTLKRGMQKSITVSIYILAPLLLGLGAVSPHVVPLLYSDKWGQAVPFMQVSCVTLLIIIVNNTNLQILYATGNVGVVLRQEFVKKLVMFCILAVTVFISPIAIAIGIFFHSFHELLWTTHANRLVVGYSFLEQMKDITPSLILGVSMAAIDILIGSFFSNHQVALFLQILFGVTYYIMMSHVFKIREFYYVKQMIINTIKSIR